MSMKRNIKCLEISKYLIYYTSYQHLLFGLEAINLYFYNITLSPSWYV